jgi:hypothetical protein
MMPPARVVQIFQAVFQICNSRMRPAKRELESLNSVATRGMVFAMRRARSFGGRRSIAAIILSRAAGTVSTGSDDNGKQTMITMEERRK